MLTAIRELASHKDDTTAARHIAAAKYLEACNHLFEEGILSHEVINSQTSPALQNMKLGFTFFQEWHKELSQSDTGNAMVSRISYQRGQGFPPASVSPPPPVLALHMAVM